MLTPWLQVLYKTSWLALYCVYKRISFILDPKVLKYYLANVVIFSHAGWSGTLFAQFIWYFVKSSWLYNCVFQGREKDLEKVTESYDLPEEGLKWFRWGLAWFFVILILIVMVSFHDTSWIYICICRYLAWRNARTVSNFFYTSHMVWDYFDTLMQDLNKVLWYRSINIMVSWYHGIVVLISWHQDIMV